MSSGSTGRQGEQVSMTRGFGFIGSSARCARFLFEILFGLRIDGIDRIPRRGGLLVASNHISDLDPPILGSSFPRILHFMAKSELFRGRFLTHLFTGLNAFPINRTGVDRNALRLSESILLAGGALVVFPEGTRSKDGRPLPVKPGIGLIALRTGVPVIPVHISGSDKPLSALIRSPGIRVSFGDPITPAEIGLSNRNGGFAETARLIMDRICKTGAV